jgi:glycosyltransferase involved in cell wall biosynthesis
MTAVSTVSEISDDFRGDGRIRIAHLQLLPLITGVQTVTMEEFKRLDRKRFNPYLICQQPGPLSEAGEREGIQCLFVPELRRSISPRQDWLALWRLRALFREHEFDIVHTHSSKTGVLGRIAAYLAGVPAVVHTVHGYACPAARNGLEKALFVIMEWIGARCCGAMIVLKEHDRQIGRRYLHVPSQRLHLLANGVDTDLYRPAGQAQRRRIRRARLGIDDETTAIGMVGRLWQQKNPACFVDAAAEVLEKRRDVRFFLLGDGELRETLEQRIRRYGIASHVRILGWANDIPDLLPGLDVFVLPSRWEGLSLALLEALSSGVAAVVSDIPGNRDIITHEVNGLLFDDGDSGDLAEKLLRLVQESRLRERLALRGRVDVVAHYRLEDRMARVTELYQRLLSGKAVPI